MRTILLTLLLVLSSTAARAEPREAPDPTPGWREQALGRFGFKAPTGRRTRRVAATTILTEHPSSLALLQVQFRKVKRAIDRLPAGELLRYLDQPLMTPDKQVREFKRQSLQQGIATGKMIDFEGKPMPPEVIPRYVRAIERAGMRPGIEGDRFLLLRLPGAAENSEKDQQIRARVFENIVSANLSRALAGRPLPLDRLIVPETQSLGQMLEVHDTYDRVAAAAVDRKIAAGRLPASRRDEVLARLRQVQVVPLVENADTVVNADRLVGQYLDAYRQRYGQAPRQMVVFVAGSDLNREVGPVAGQVCRTVMRSRLVELQRRHPEVDVIQWAGIGSGPMRSGAGRFPGKMAMLHPGMTFTVQPDQIDQPNLEETVAAMGRAALRARPRPMSAEKERRLLAVGAAFADIHARLSLRSALSTVRLNNLLTPLQQRGRKASAANLIYEKDGQLYLRSVQPKEASAARGATYGRTLDISGYAGLLDESFAPQKRAIERRQRSIDRLWPAGLADPRAIGGAFARYLQGDALTTVAGLGHAIEAAQAQLGKREVNRLRPLITFLVRNDGFVLTRDATLVRQRIQVLQPNLNRAQIDRQVKWYFADLAALERFLGRPLESLISTADRARYEAASRKLYSNPAFVRYLQGNDIPLTDWREIMESIVPLLSNPSWNRIGALPPSSPVPVRLA